MVSFRQESKIIQFTFELIILAAVWSKDIGGARLEAKQKTKKPERIIIVRTTVRGNMKQGDR